MKSPKVGLARHKFDRIVSILKKRGYKEGTMNLHDFWQENQEKLRSKIYGKEVSDDTFSLQVRWYSKQGEAEQEAIRKHIQKKIADNNKKASEQAFGTQITKRVLIDFSDWSVTKEGKQISGADYQKVNYYDGSKMNSLLDFRGIKLWDMQLNGCEFKNCCFDAAFFDHSHIINVEFTNTTFTRASFYKCEIIGVDLSGTTILSNSYVDGAYLSQIKDLNSKTLPYPFVPTNITYFQLLGQLINRITLNDGQYSDALLSKGFTVYNAIPTEELKTPELKELREYITWFQSWSHKLYNFRGLKWNRKVELSIAIFLTKYWSSATAFAGVILFIDLIFASCYFLFSTSFHSLDIPGNHLATFVKSFYYSTVTLMTLGYGDIYPLYWGGQIGIIIEVCCGYTILGLFLYLISRRVERLY